jgi:arginine decarboxylase
MAKNYGQLYNILGWGEPYFTVNSKGHLCAKPHGRETAQGQEIVHSVIEEVLAGTTSDNKKVQFPMILRFPDVLKVRLDSLHAAFKDAIATTGYRNRYQGV